MVQLSSSVAAALTLLLAAPAAAAPDRSGRVAVTVEVELEATPEPDPFGWPDEWSYGYRALGGFRGTDELGSVTDDGRFRFGCALRDHQLRLELSTNPARWPEHLPEELSCSVGRYDVTARVRAIPALYTDPSELHVDLERGIEIRRRQLEPGGIGYSNTEVALPEGFTWPAQAVVATRDGRPWADTSCQVDGGPRGTMRVHVSHLASDGEGLCALTDDSGRVHALPVRVVQVP